MKIAILTNIPTPYRTSFFNTLYKILKENEDELFVFYCSKTEPNRKWIYTEDDNLYPHKILPGLHINLKTVYPHVNISIIRELRKLNPTHLIVAGSWNTPTMILSAFLYNSKYVKKLFWSESHDDSVRYKSNFFKNLKNIFYKRFDYFITPNYRSYNYITNDIGIKNKGNINLPNLVDDPFFSTHPILDKLPLRQKYFVPDNATVFIQVAQLEDRKGALELIEGFNLLSRNHKDIYLVLLGDGPLLDTLNSFVLKNQLEQKIRITGHLEKNRIKEYLYLSDAFVLATKKDPNPLSPIEAIFCSLPILLSAKAGNVNEIVSEGINGYVLNNISPDAIYTVLNIFLELDTNIKSEMSKASFNIANEKFSCNEVSSKFINDLKNIV